MGKPGPDRVGRFLGNLPPSPASFGPSEVQLRNTSFASGRDVCDVGMGFPLLEPQVQTPSPAPELLLRVGSESLLCPSPAAPTHSWGLGSPSSLQWGAEQTPASRSRAPRQCAHRTWKRRLPLLYLVWPGVGTSLWSQDQGPLRTKVLGRPPRGSRRP